MSQNKGFDSNSFYQSLLSVVELKNKNWKIVAEETGVSASTLTRMSQGKKPDAASLAALSAWADLNPSDFVNAPYKNKMAVSFNKISSLLRNDPNLDSESAKAIEAIVRTAYKQMSRKNNSTNES